jgi:integrase
VFVSEAGAIVDSRSASRFFEQVWTRARLKSKTFHQLRHDFASLLLAQGVALWVVSKILRHKNIQVTSDY